MGTFHPWIVRLVFLAATTASTSDLPEREKDALRTFYTSLQGTNWTNNGGWTGLFNSSVYYSPCSTSWYGLATQCGASGQATVTGISFISENRLNGTLDSALVDVGTTLPNLTSIEFEKQFSLSGTIPGNILCDSNLVNKLEKLSLEETAISGYIPGSFDPASGSSSSCLDSRPATAPLRNFFIRDCKLSGTLPSALICGNAAADNMYSFKIDDNFISGSLPSSSCLANRSSSSDLRYFYVHGNNMTGFIPSGFMCGNSAAARMRKLRFQDNRFSGYLPSNDCLNSRPSSSTYLDYLNIHANRLSGTIPSKFVCGSPSARRMKNFYASANSISGSLPNSTCWHDRTSSFSLKYLWAHGNSNLGGEFPDGLICGTDVAEKLHTLRVYSTQISGTLPNNDCLNSRSRSTQLSVLYANWNKISGTLPSGLLCGSTAAEKLSSLKLFGNELSGTMPSNECINSRSKNTKLVLFKMYDSKVSGTIPPSLMCGSPSSEKLFEFTMYKSQLSGTLPSEACWANRTDEAALRMLRVHTSGLSGTIPTSLMCKNSSIEILQLQNTKLSGELPSCPYGTGNAMLKQFIAYDCKFSGNLPSWRNKLRQLSIISLSNNKGLEGTMGRMLPDSLEYLILQGTNVHGTLDDLARAPNLQKVLAAANQLSGTIPPALFEGEKLRQVVLSQNRISGAIPETIEKAVRLEKLRLNENRIQGGLPVGLSAILPNLTELQLHLNQLSCDVPMELRGEWLPAKDKTIKVLQGSLIGCTGLENLRTADKNGESYVCPEDAFLIPWTIAGISGVGTLIVFYAIWHWHKYRVKAENIEFDGEVAEVHDDRQDKLESKKTRNNLEIIADNNMKLALIALFSAVLLVVIGLPSFMHAPSTVKCRYYDRYSMALIRGFETQASAATSSVGWVIVILMVITLSLIAGAQKLMNTEVEIRSKKTKKNRNRKGSDQIRRRSTAMKETFSLANLGSESKNGIALSSMRRVESDDVREERKVDPLQEEEEEEEEEEDKVSTIWKQGIPMKLMRWLAAFCAMIACTVIYFVIVAILFFPSLGNVMVETSNEISKIWKLFIVFSLAVMQLAVPGTIVPMGAEVISKLAACFYFERGMENLSREGRKNRALWKSEFVEVLITSLDSLGNIVAPLASQLLLDPSCLRAVFSAAEVHPSETIATNDCQFGTYVYFADGSFSHFECKQYFTLESGEYSSSFRFRPDYCAGRVMHTFTPFFITVAMSSLIFPLIQALIPLCFPKVPSLLGILSEITLCAMWPEQLLKQSTEKRLHFVVLQLAKTIEAILRHERRGILSFIGGMNILVTMGIAAPIVGAFTGFAVIVLGCLHVYDMYRLNKVLLRARPEVYHTLGAQGSIPFTAMCIWFASSFLFWLVLGLAYNFGWMLGLYLIMGLCSAIPFAVRLGYKQALKNHQLDEKVIYNQINDDDNDEKPFDDDPVKGSTTLGLSTVLTTEQKQKEAGVVLGLPVTEKEAAMMVDGTICVASHSNRQDPTGGLMSVSEEEDGRARARHWNEALDEKVEEAVYIGYTVKPESNQGSRNVDSAKKNSTDHSKHRPTRVRQQDKAKEAEVIDSLFNIEPLALESYELEGTASIFNRNYDDSGNFNGSRESTAKLTPVIAGRGRPLIKTAEKKKEHINNSKSTSITRLHINNSFTAVPSKVISGGISVDSTMERVPNSLEMKANPDGHAGSQYPLNGSFVNSPRSIGSVASPRSRRTPTRETSQISSFSITL
eukprot:jgi/Bigna1/67746/fgenesh1_pg.4_\